MQVLVVMPPGAVGHAHPVRALQLGEAVACAPRDRSGCCILLIASAIFVSPTHSWGDVHASLGCCDVSRPIMAAYACQHCTVDGKGTR